MTIDGTAVGAIADLARAATGAEQLDPGGYYVYQLGDRINEIDLTGDKYQDSPKRKAGITTVRDVPSWLAYWGKHSDVASEVYADRQALTVTAVLDAHTEEAPRFGGHRLVLKLQHSDEFVAWQAASGRLMNQTVFAEFIEDHRAAITDPPGADMLELAQSFHATNKVTFKSGSLLASGQRQLTYVEEVNASAGSKGQLTIPATFRLALQVFEGAEQADEVSARLRYRINDGALQMSFVLDQLAAVVSGAFAGVVGLVEAGVAVPVLYGTPAG